MSVAKPLYLVVYNHRNAHCYDGKRVELIFKVHNFSSTEYVGNIIWNIQGMIDIPNAVVPLPDPVEADGDCWLSEEEFAKFQVDNIELFL